MKVVLIFTDRVITRKLLPQQITDGSYVVVAIWTYFVLSKSLWIFIIDLFRVKWSFEEDNGFNINVKIFAHEILFELSK